MDEGHGILSATWRGHRRLAVGVLLEVPLDQSLVIATLAGVKDASGVRRFRRRLIARWVFLIMMALLAHGNDQGSVFIANDRHGRSLLGGSKVLEPVKAYTQTGALPPICTLRSAPSRAESLSEG